MAFAHDISSARAGIAQRALAVLRGAVAHYRRYRLERRTYRELDALSDRELEDLGLNRAMLRSIAREAAWQR